MPIFIPLFIILFIAVPLVLTRLAAPLIGARTRGSWFLLFIVISVLNWQMWQAKPPPPAQSVAVQGLAP